MIRVAMLLIALGLAAPARAQNRAVEVDLELLLMVDVSRSMSPNELEIQRRGYVSALTSDEVVAALRSGMLGRIALAYVEWAGTQHVAVEWRLIEDRADLQAFADALTETFHPAMRRTSISGALVNGTGMIQGNAFTGMRRVIDVSGDGPNNQGIPVTIARDAAIAQGIIINGLPLLTAEGFGNQASIDQLDVYYRACVIGGPGAFVMAVADWQDFGRAVRRKLVLEIAGLARPERFYRAQFQNTAPFDCLIGEKLWNQRRGFLGGPGAP